MSCRATFTNRRLPPTASSSLIPSADILAATMVPSNHRLGIGIDELWGACSLRVASVDEAIANANNASLTLEAVFLANLITICQPLQIWSRVPVEPWEFPSANNGSFGGGLTDRA